MNIYEGYTRGKSIKTIYPSGDNSTMFTDCCGAAICDSELCCPGCGSKVIGHDDATDHERGRTRWYNATRLWKR